MYGGLEKTRSLEKFRQVRFSLLQVKRRVWLLALVVGNLEQARIGERANRSRKFVDSKIERGLQHKAHAHAAGLGLHLELHILEFAFAFQSGNAGLDLLLRKWLPGLLPN